MLPNPFARQSRQIVRVESIFRDKEWSGMPGRENSAPHACCRRDIVRMAGCFRRCQWTSSHDASSAQDDDDDDDSIYDRVSTFCGLVFSQTTPRRDMLLQSSMLPENTLLLRPMLVRPCIRYEKSQTLRSCYYALTWSRYSRLVYASSSSPFRRFRSIGSSLISIPGPIDREFL